MSVPYDETDNIVSYNFNIISFVYNLKYLEINFSVGDKMILFLLIYLIY